MALSFRGTGHEPGAAADGWGLGFEQRHGGGSWGKRRVSPAHPSIPGLTNKRVFIKAQEGARGKLSRASRWIQIALTPPGEAWFQDTILRGRSQDPGLSVQVSEDVTKDPIDHVQSLVLLQHDVVGIPVLSSLLVHLQSHRGARGQDRVATLTVENKRGQLPSSELQEPHESSAGDSGLVKGTRSTALETASPEHGTRHGKLSSLHPGTGASPATEE